MEGGRGGDGSGSAAKVMRVDLASALSTVALAALPVLLLRALWRRCRRTSVRLEQDKNK